MNKRMLSIFFLGLFFIRHWIVKLWKLITRPDQLKLFRRNFIEDDLIEFTREDHEVLRGLSRCVLCDRCKYYNPFIDSTLRGYGLTPSDIPSVLTRAQPEFPVVGNLAREMLKFDLDAIYCPFDVPLREGVELIISLNERLEKEKKLYGG